MTTRRLAERVEYSQPVLYSHLNGKDAIMRAVAIEGFGELAPAWAVPGWTPRSRLRQCTPSAAPTWSSRPSSPARFILPTGVKFAHAETPPPLRAAFDEFVSCFRPDNQRRELFAEVTWSALHGIAALTESGRIPERPSRAARLSSSPRSPGTASGPATA
nr:TetR family transcriptional regulator [Micromonospora thermarum]